MSSNDTKETTDEHEYTSKYHKFHTDN